jgi:hypothetical protein
MLEIKLYLATGTTLKEIRAFVKATEAVDGDEAVIRYNFQDEMDALGAAVDIDG